MDFFCYLPVSVQQEVFAGRLIMNREEAGDALVASHELFISEVSRMPTEVFEYALPGKWSAAVQLAHLSLCLEALSKALQLKEALAEKFGVIDRPLMSTMDLVKYYREQLAGGGKAPERFIPQVVTIADRDEWIGRVRAVTKSIKDDLLHFQEDDLDRLALPHPFLGKLSIREMMYLLTFHAPYHLAQVKYQLSQRQRSIHSTSN